MQPAVMFRKSALNSHRRSDRRIALICSTRKDNDDIGTRMIHIFRDVEKLSDNFLVFNKKTLICTIDFIRTILKDISRINGDNDSIWIQATACGGVDRLGDGVLCDLLVWWVRWVW